MTEFEMAGWHQQFNGHEFEQAPGDGTSAYLFRGHNPQQQPNRSLLWGLIRSDHRASVCGGVELWGCHAAGY